MESIREYDAKLDSKKRLTLREAGYELVTVSELLGLEPLVLDIPASTEATE